MQTKLSSYTTLAKFNGIITAVLFYLILELLYKYNDGLITFNLKKILVRINLKCRRQHTRILFTNVSGCIKSINITNIGNFLLTWEIFNLLKKNNADKFTDNKNTMFYRPVNTEHYAGKA